MKTAISGQNTSVGTGTANGYRYPWCILVQKRSGTGTTQSGTGTQLKVRKWYRYHNFQLPCFCLFCTVKSRIRAPIVRDPKK